MIPYVTVILISITCGIYWYCTRTFDFWKNRNVRGPQPMPMFGNIKDVALRRTHIGDVLKDVYDQFPNEKVIGVYRMTTPTLIVKDLDLLKDILMKDFDNFPDRGIRFREGIGLGLNLFHAEEKMWRVLRHKLTPMFSSGKIKGMYKFLDVYSDKLIDCIKSSKQAEHDAKPLLKNYTMCTISAGAFGIDIDAEEAKLLLEKLQYLDKIIFRNPLWFEFELLFPGFFRTFGFSPFPKMMTDFFYNLVDKVFSERDGVPSDRQDFMDMLLKMKQEGVQETKYHADRDKITLTITDSIVAAQAFTFYAGGYETSSTTLSNMLYHLARNPNIQDKLVAEIDAVRERHAGKITYDSLTEMTYLSQVFDETLRMHPILESLFRWTKSDYKFSGTDIVVKKGQIIFIPLVGIHYDEKYYPNPHEFDPDRFSSENVKNRHPYAHMPFGQGHRSCIGARFGKIQTNTCIAKLLTNFRVEPSPNTPKVLKVDPWSPVYAPSDGYFLNFVKRE